MTRGWLLVAAVVLWVAALSSQTRRSAAAEFRTLMDRPGLDGAGWTAPQRTEIPGYEMWISPHTGTMYYTGYEPGIWAMERTASIRIARRATGST